MEREFERAMALLSRYEDGLRNLLPADAEIFDAHVHLGHDIDGQIGVYEELERINEAAGVSRCSDRFTLFHDSLGPGCIHRSDQRHRQGSSRPLTAWRDDHRDANGDGLDTQHRHG